MKGCSESIGSALRFFNQQLTLMLIFRKPMLVVHINMLKQHLSIKSNHFWDATIANSIPICSTSIVLKGYAVF